MIAKSNTSVWANGPYRLLPIPGNDENLKRKNHSAVKCASLMASAHNCLLRALNAILLQGPYIPDATQTGYVAQDVKDFVFYIWSWTKTVDHHHHAEETAVFPLVEKAIGKEGFFEDPVHQHEAFHGGLKELQDYADAHKENPTEYRWTEAKRIIDSFGPTMCDHLAQEIDVLLTLQQYDSESVDKAFAEGEKVAKNAASLDLLYDIFPLILGGCDRTYKGSETFPELPRVMVYALVYYFSRARRGSWRFSPCDLWGRPVSLHMQPSSK